MESLEDTFESIITTQSFNTSNFPQNEGFAMYYEKIPDKQHLAFFPSEVKSKDEEKQDTLNIEMIK